MEPITLRFVLSTRAGAAAAWDVLADTDRFNRAAGLAFDLTEEPLEPGRVRRTGSLRRFGLQIAWEDQPVEFVRPSWLRVERRFLNGPLARLEVELHFAPTSAGTEVTYEARLFPRNLFVKPVVAVDARLSTGPQLLDALTRGVALLDGGPDVYDPAPPALPPEVSGRLDVALGAVGPEPLRRVLDHEVRYAPLTRQARMMPRVLARLAGVDDDVAIGAMLQAVGDGLLQLRFEAICPSCLGGVEVSQPVPGAVHCVSCNLPFDGSWPGSVHVVFRPSSWVRSVHVPRACLVSPGRTPQVVARQEVGAGARARVAAELAAGLWRLIVGAGPDGATVEVVDGGPTEALVYVGAGVRPELVTLRVGASTLLVVNQGDAPVTVQLERRFSLPLALTASQLLEHPSAAFAAPAVRRLDSEVVRACLVVVVAARRAASVDLVDAVVTMRARGPIATGSADGFYVAAYASDDVALALAGSLADDPRWSVCVDCGQVLAARLGGSSSSGSGGSEPALVAGTVVDRVMQSVQEVAPRRVGLDREALGDAAFRATIDRWRADGRLTIDDHLPVRTHDVQFVDPSAAPEGASGSVVLGLMVGRGRFGRRYLATEAGVACEAEHVPFEALVMVEDAHRCRSAFQGEGWAASRLVRLAKGPFLVDRPPPGRSLERVLGAPMPAASAHRLATSLFSVLGGLHAAGVVWRDLRPGDLWWADDGSVVLRGVGAAAPFGAHDALTDAGPFAAPEVRAGGPVDGRADLYAATKLLIHAVTGRPVGAPGPTPPLFVGLAQALAPAPSARFVSADEMIRVLRGGAG
jgi:hypothetical protein